MSERLKTTISGSFKFKPEIDRVIDAFRDMDIMVLAPEKGWIYTPSMHVYRLADVGFRPLPSERNMSVKQIEDRFLYCLSKSDFVYVVNPHGYVGDVVSMEIGFAMALNIPVYSQERIDTGLDPDPWWREITENVKVMSMEDAAIDVKRGKLIID